MARNAENHLEYCDHLLAFRFIDGSHSGPHLADEFFKVLDEAGIRHKLGQITMDNASNNNTMMRELEHLLRARGVAFHHDGNRKYVATLERDLVGTGQGVVTACRASGQRRWDLRKLIEDGNDSGYWKGKMINPAHDSMPKVQLLRDCETRWSSTFNLIDRIILLHPAIVRFLQRPEHSDLCHLSLNDYEIGVLCDIHQALEIPHVAQQTFSFERTPTLSMAIPLYKMLNHEWKNLKATIPELSHYISVATGKIDEYIEEGRKTRIYALAMILNPAMKFEWMKAHWLPEDVKKAQNWILEMVSSCNNIVWLTHIAQSDRSLPAGGSISQSSYWRKIE
ncbi:hypothetical protein BDN67DRAFT_1060585 [Paxillus ammoniavirescens]|nr:hypothetical protein BDN67DRAFT_1060585 [Paxillus ammoniavirescens]